MALKTIILKYTSERWEFGTIDYPNNKALPETCYIFLDKDSYPDSEGSRADLLYPFNVPYYLSNDMCTARNGFALNGYFGCRATYDDSAEKLESYSTWFRSLVKMVQEDRSTLSKEMTALKTKNKPKYFWYEMDFFACWDHLGRCRVLCIDTPKELPSKLRDALQKAPPDIKDPFGLHVPLIDQIVKLYDNSIWSIRHPIRTIEKNRQIPDFEEMHEISRHAVHISEVLSVTIETIENIQRQQKAIYEVLSSDLGRTYREQMQEYTSFQLQILKNLKQRSSSNYERLKSEMVLAYNMIAQQHNITARQDNNVMKSIGLLTMTFLPATFISALFSTTFFTFGDDGWQASEKVWIYCVITIPLTVLVLVFWRLWLAGSISHMWKKFLEKLKNEKTAASNEDPPPPSVWHWKGTTVRSAIRANAEP